MRTNEQNEKQPSQMYATKNRTIGRGRGDIEMNFLAKQHQINGQPFAWIMDTAKAISNA